MRYNKEDAQMTQGLAVLCMVILHLFCRTGSDVLGTPLIWINESTPLVFWFGFLRKSVYRFIPSAPVMRSSCCGKREKVISVPEWAEVFGY